jgi:hypothetical protein
VFLRRPLVLVPFPAHLMFSGGYGTVLAAVGAVGVDSVLVFCEAICVADFGSSYCSARSKGFGYEWFKSVLA